jgi:hypothetical protein
MPLLLFFYYEVTGQYDSSVYRQIVYTATTQTDFMRIVAT